MIFFVEKLFFLAAIENLKCSMKAALCPHAGGVNYKYGLLQGFSALTSPSHPSHSCNFVKVVSPFAAQSTHVCFCTLCCSHQELLNHNVLTLTVFLFVLPTLQLEPFSLFV